MPTPGQFFTKVPPVASTQAVAWCFLARASLLRELAVEAKTPPPSHREREVQSAMEL